MKKILLNLFMVFTSLASIQAQCGGREDMDPPIFTAIDNGDGSQVNPFKNIQLSTVNAVPTGVYYFEINGATMQGYLDNDTDGGGWLMILNYVHVANTNPDLNIRTTDLPLLGSSTLGDNESGTNFWGHTGNALLATIDFSEMRFYGETTGHARKIHFKTDYVNAINYAKTGSGSFNGIEGLANFTTFSDHTAFIPAQAVNEFTNEGDLALTNFPFWRSGLYHWGIKGGNSRWEVDDVANGTESTIHRVFVRAGASIDNLTAEVSLDANGNISATPDLWNIPATDNCSEVSFSLSQTDFDCTAIGVNTIQLIAADDSNNTTAIDVTLIIKDDIVPVIDTGGSRFLTIDLDENGEVTFDAAALGVTVNDNCGTPQVTLSRTSLNCSNINAIPGNFVRITATDAQGNTIQSNVFVSVQDVTDPIIDQCASPFEVTLDSSGRYTLTADELGTGISDNCGFTTSFNIEELTIANIGDNTVTMTATDNAGNTNSCSTTVTVNFGGCPDDIIVDSTPDLCGAIVDYGSFAITSGLPSGSLFPIGTTTIAFEVLDENNQSIQCSFDVTVNDLTAPQFFVADQNIDVSTSDVTLAIDDFIGLEVGDPSYFISRQGTFSPATLSGNETGVTLGDDELSANLPIGFNFEFFGDSYSEFYISSNGFITFLNENSNDEEGCCSGASLPDDGDDIKALIAYAWSDLDPSSGGIISYETMGTAPNRTLIIDFDGVYHFEGSEWKITTQVKLFETSNIVEIHSTSIIPVNVPDEDYLVTQGIENATQDEAFFLPGRNAGSNWGTTNEYVAFIPSTNGVFDACGVDTIDISQTDFDCSDIGDTTVSITVTDVNGNSSLKTVVVTVTGNDTTLPVINCPVDPIETADVSGFYRLPDFFVTGQAAVTDNCTDTEDVVVSQDPIAGTDLEIGDHLVSLSAIDASGNESTCSFTLTIEDGATLGVTSFENIEGLSVSPNPTKGKVFVTNNSSVALETYLVYDIAGRVVDQGIITSSIDLSLQPSGLYLIELTGADTSTIIKMIKE